MKVRLVIACFDAAMPVNVGGEVEQTARTFEIDIPDEAAELLRPRKYYHANVVGIELPKEAKP